jgi:hypothetical protein
MAPCRVGIVNRAVAAAVAVVADRERRGRPGVVLLLLEEAGFVGFADLGGDDVEDPAAQDPQRLGVVVAGELDEVVFGSEADRRVEVVGERGDGVDDDVGLVEQQPAGGEGVADGLVVTGQGGGQPGGAVRIGPGGAGVVGPPGGGRSGALGGADLQAGGLVQDPHGQLADLGL